MPGVNNSPQQFFLYRRHRVLKRKKLLEFNTPSMLPVVFVFFKDLFVASIASSRSIPSDLLVACFPFSFLFFPRPPVTDPDFLPPRALLCAALSGETMNVYYFHEEP